jgi:glycine/D-amino acid oxidase-like deaminating enzyme
MNGNGLIPISPERPDVVVVGGGVAGTMTALKLAGTPGIGRIVVLDREGHFGRGLAYSTNKPWHRTNVPSSKMGGIDDSKQARRSGSERPQPVGVNRAIRS